MQVLRRAEPFVIPILRLLQRTASFLRKFSDKPVFNFLACPGSFSQEGQARLYAGIVQETANRDATSHLNPAMPFHQLLNDSFKRNSMQWIARMRRWEGHERKIESRLTVARLKSSNPCYFTAIFRLAGGSGLGETLN